MGGHLDPQGRTVDETIARLASRSHGVVSRGELLTAGITADRVRRRVRSGALIAEFPGVYRMGHAAPSTKARYLAAVKACGPDAVLSGLAAAYLLGLLRRPPSLPQVTTLTERRIEGINTYRSRRIDRRDITTHKRIPVTTPARTLVDIAADLKEDELASATKQASSTRPPPNRSRPS